MATLHNLLDFETDPVFTENSDFFNEQEGHWSSRYGNEYNAVQHRLSQAVLTVPPVDHVERSPHEPPRKGTNKKKKTQFLHTFPKYPYDPAIDGGETTWTVHDEIKVMVNVQAYFQVAHKASSYLGFNSSYEKSDHHVHSHSVSLTMFRSRSSTSSIRISPKRSNIL